MSRLSFTLLLNPLLLFLNDPLLSRVTKYKTMSNKELLTFCFMDDVNYVVQSLSSLLNSISYMHRFKFASGLEMNLSKTVGKFYNKQGVHRVEHLPDDFDWEENIRVVKINHSPKHMIASQWKNKLSILRKEIQFCKATAVTFQSKAIISKNKLLSKLTYISSVHVMPSIIKKSVDKALLGFLVPISSGNLSDQEISGKIMNFAAPKQLGGYEIDHISLHADLMLLKPVMKYLKCLAGNIPLSCELFFVEYHIGMKLCSFFGIKVNNRTPHTSQPSEVYCHILQTITVYDITKEELILGSINAIYKRIVLDGNRRNARLKYYRLYSNVLPSYLHSFNYKLYNNILPVKTMFREYALDTDSRCEFCDVGPESIFHMFGSCEKLVKLWKIASETVVEVTGNFF